MKPELNILLIGNKLSCTLKSTLMNLKNINVIGPVSSGEEALNLYPSFKPDIILIYMVMPGMSGLETARWIKEQGERTPIILISEYIQEIFLLAAMDMKLQSYLTVNVSSSIIEHALHKLIQGLTYFQFAIESAFNNIRSENELNPLDAHDWTLRLN
jgi:DNA-binding NarL/FixJ family response regulator